MSLAAGRAFGPGFVRLVRGWRLAALALLLALLALLPQARAQSPAFSDAELDQMLAPIALFPDSLLSQVLMASTYPADVKDAADWSKAHPDAKGDAAVKQVEGQPWDPSVQSLVAFPQVLAMMRERPTDVQRLGDAFLADPGRVMDRVQFLRRKAQEAGNLKSNEQQKVSVQAEASQQVIVIEPAQPQTVFVPVYQPTVVYGTWWHPGFAPYVWPPPPYYYPGGAFVAGFVWGAAITGINNALWGGFNWGRGDVNINVNRYNNINVNNRIDSNRFVHNPERRRDVPYRDAKSREQYGRKPLDGAKEREAYRGKDGRDADRAKAADALKTRGADPSAGRERLQGADRDKAAAAVRDTDRGRAGGAPGALDRGSSHGSDGGALSGVRDAGASRADLDRGRASHQSMAQPAARSASTHAAPAAKPAAQRPAPAARPAGGGARRH
jgi:hypothetical protein